MFIKHDDKVINTDNVSNILIDNEKQKIIFNTNYPVSLHDNVYKLIPDYVYFVCDVDDFLRIRDKIMNLKWISSDFGKIKHGEFKHNARLINPDCVSFIKIEDWKPRIIFNLNTSISFYKNDAEITSDFIFYDYQNSAEMNTDLELITQKLKIEG